MDKDIEQDACETFAPHPFLKQCKVCQKAWKDHSLTEDDVDKLKKYLKAFSKEPEVKPHPQYAWTPPNCPENRLDEYFKKFPEDKVPRHQSEGQKNRLKRLACQIPLPDVSLEKCRFLDAKYQEDFEKYAQEVQNTVLRIGKVKEWTFGMPIQCPRCFLILEEGELVVTTSDNGGQAFHPVCFTCFQCGELLADLIHCCDIDGTVFCLRHYWEDAKKRLKCYIEDHMKNLVLRAQLDKKLKYKTAQSLANSADKLFRQAQGNIDKDEETAYVQFMGFIEIVILLKKRPDFQKIKKKKKIIEIYDIANEKIEELKANLKKRYTKQYIKSCPDVASENNTATGINSKEKMTINKPADTKVLRCKSAPGVMTKQREITSYTETKPPYGSGLVRPTGLINLGNTCFLNSVLQCLSHTTPLTNFIFREYEYIRSENRQSTGGELVEEFAAVIKALWMGQYKSFSPTDFKNSVKKQLGFCLTNDQEDCHEFLLRLMGELHADLSKKKYENIIPDIFEGLLSSTLTCFVCGEKSSNFEQFYCLSLPIMATICTLKECVSHFLRAEKMCGEAAWDCPRCKKKTEAEKILQISQLPEVLIIQLKRFSYEDSRLRKLQTYVDFDINLEIPYAGEDRRIYSIYGIVNHYGSVTSGHYTAYCKNEKWFKYDDHEVSEINSSDIKTSAAYLLFYIATDSQSGL